MKNPVSVGFIGGGRMFRIRLIPLYEKIKP